MSVRFDDFNIVQDVALELRQKVIIIYERWSKICNIYDREALYFVYGLFTMARQLGLITAREYLDILKEIQLVCGNSPAGQELHKNANSEKCE